MEKDDKDLPSDPVYYYSREHRLSRASPRVRALNEETTERPGIFKSLFATRGNTLVFVSILIIGLMFGINARFSGKDKGKLLGGNTVAAVIIQEEGVPVLGIIKTTPKSGEAYTGAV